MQVQGLLGASEGLLDLPASCTPTSGGFPSLPGRVCPRGHSRTRLARERASLVGHSSCVQGKKGEFLEEPVGQQQVLWRGSCRGSPHPRSGAGEPSEVSIRAILEEGGRAEALQAAREGQGTCRQSFQAGVTKATMLLSAMSPWCGGGAMSSHIGRGEEVEKNGKEWRPPSF